MPIFSFCRCSSAVEIEMDVAGLDLPEVPHVPELTLSAVTPSEPYLR